MALSRKSSRRLRLRVPASTSNVGTGFDALGIALDLSLRVTWQPAETNRLERKGAIAESVLSTGRDPVIRGMRRAAILAGSELESGAVTVEAGFPPARGLGASGAGLVAGLLLGNRLTGGRIGEGLLLQEAIQLEGHPENATASLLGSAHWSLRDADGNWLHLPVSLHRDLRFLIIVPPYPLSTQRAREVLPSSVSFQRAAAQAQRTPALLEGLRKLDPALLRAGIQDELHVAARLKQLAGASAMVDYANRSGAIATTLSGAGSALLVVTRTGQVASLEERLKKRVKRLWGEAGSVLRARAASKGPAWS